MVTFALIPLILVLLAVALLIGVLVFEVLMFLDVLKNPKLNDSEKIIWVIGMFLLHPIIAIVYYFVAHSRLQKP